MTAQEYAFSVLALVGVVAAIRVVTARNVVRAALYLVVTLASVGGAYLVLGAEFVGWVQILIYVGAIVILFLFGLMLTRAPIGRQALDNPGRLVPALIALAVLAGLAGLILGAFAWSDPRLQLGHAPTGVVGEELFRRYVLPFEAVSFVLLAALIGAIVLSRRDEAP